MNLRKRAEVSRDEASVGFGSPGFVVIPHRLRWFFALGWLVVAVAMLGLSVWAMRLPNPSDVNILFLLLTLAMLLNAPMRFLVWAWGYVPWPWRGLGAVYFVFPILQTGVMVGLYHLPTAPAPIVLVYGLLASNVYLQTFMFMDKGDYRHFFAAFVSDLLLLRAAVWNSELSGSLYVPGWFNVVAGVVVTVWILERVGFPRGSSKYFGHLHY